MKKSNVEYVNCLDQSIKKHIGIYSWWWRKSKKERLRVLANFSVAMSHIVIILEDLKKKLTS